MCEHCPKPNAHPELAKLAQRDTIGSGFDGEPGLELKSTRRRPEPAKKRAKKVP